MRVHQKIVDVLSKKLEQESYVHAAWLEGSMATKDADEHSDIDIWFDVDDDSVDETFAAVEKAIKTLGTIDNQFAQANPNEHIRSRVYHLAGTPATLQIDVDLQLHSRDFTFTRGVKDQDIIVLFDKDGTIKFQDLDEAKLKRENLAKLKDTESRYHGMRPAVARQIERGKYLEALVYYHRWVLEPLLEVSRIAYQPTKTEFGLKHVYKDLPSEVTDELESLFVLNSVEELPAKLQQADSLFEKVTKRAKE